MEKNKNEKPTERPPENPINDICEAGAPHPYPCGRVLFYDGRYHCCICGPCLGKIPRRLS